MVGVEVGMDDDVHVLGLEALTLELVDKVAGAVLAIGVGAGAHAGIDENALVRGADEEAAEIELEPAFFKDIVGVRGPRVTGSCWEKCGGFPGGGDHVENSD